MLFGETRELTGGEHLIAERCVDDEVRKAFQGIYDDYIGVIEARPAPTCSAPSRPRATSPAVSRRSRRRRSATSTRRAPSRSSARSSPRRRPTRAGLHFMDTSSAAAECITLMAAAGAVVHLFPTGQGNIIGNPIEPVVKTHREPEHRATMSRAHRPRLFRDC